MKKNITSLEELEKEQEKLKIMMKVTKQEFVRSFANNQIHAKDFLLKKVAIPVGAAGLGFAAVKSMTSPNHNHDHEKAKEPSFSSMDLISKLLPLGINLLQSYLLEKQGNKLEEIDEDQPGNATPSSPSNLKSVA